MKTKISCLELYKLDIMAVQEVRWDGSGSLKAHGLVKILYSGLEKHERGVGFIIKNKLLSNIVKFEPLSDRKPKIIIGDFNAKIGKETVYRPTIGNDSLHDESNQNGNKLITFAAARNMVVISTMFPYKNIHK
ncbi:Uncharacterized protein FWK35_00003693 [Aphis craccivora]|uniref:Craniofacial development protein 2-like n=1 Tax=Aphis craccivora TaxID=307492 RepID=A0A6G0ZPI7_APHCR|nr:Uncharacterized protein FWK35_00003693 [Aphis craccivora]